MKEYEIQVKSITTVYVEADNDEEALDAAYEQALSTTPDFNYAVIIDAVDMED